MFIQNTKISWAHAIATALLAVFFIYAGVSKFIPKENKKRDYTELVAAVADGSYSAPFGFYATVQAMKASGFLKFIGVCQILAGLLMLLPKTRIVGLLILAPIILNIFCLHVFMHGDQEENIETGIFLALTIVLILPYLKQLKRIFQTNQ